MNSYNLNSEQGFLVALDSVENLPAQIPEFQIRLALMQTETIETPNQYITGIYFNGQNGLNILREHRLITDYLYSDQALLFI